MRHGAARIALTEYRVTLYGATPAARASRPRRGDCPACERDGLHDNHSWHCTGGQGCVERPRGFASLATEPERPVDPLTRARKAVSTLPPGQVRIALEAVIAALREMRPDGRD